MMDHEPGSNSSGAFLGPVTSPRSVKTMMPRNSSGAKRRRDDVDEESFKRPVKTVKILRKVEYSSSVHETEAEDRNGADSEAAKNKCILLILKKGFDENNNVPAVKSKKMTATSLAPLAKPGRGRFVKVRKEALQSLPELRDLINFHRSKHAELIQENQLYDSSLGIQNLSLPIAPWATGKADTAGESPSGKFQFKQPSKVATSPSSPRASLGLFRAPDKQEIESLLGKRSVEVSHMRPQMTSPKGQPGHVFAFNRQEAHRIPEVWPPHQNFYHHAAPLMVQRSAVLPVLPSGDSFINSAKENVPIEIKPKNEPEGILYPDEEEFPIHSSQVFEVRLPSLLDYQNVAILSEDLPREDSPHEDSPREDITWDRSKNDSRAKRVLEEFDLLNCPELHFDTPESGYIPNNPDFDFKSLKKETVEIEETVQTHPQDPFLEEIFEILRHEVFDPFQQPLVAASLSSEAHGSKQETDSTSKNDKGPLPGTATLRWKCKLCCEKHATKNSLITHLKVHQQPFCSICLAVTSSIKKLRTHALKAHPSNDRQDLLSEDGVIVTSKYGRRRAVLDAATLCGRRRLKSRISI